MVTVSRAQAGQMRLSPCSIRCRVQRRQRLTERKKPTFPTSNQERQQLALRS